MDPEALVGEGKDQTLILWAGVGHQLEKATRNFRKLKSQPWGEVPEGGSSLSHPGSWAAAPDLGSRPDTILRVYSTGVTVRVLLDRSPGPGLGWGAQKGLDDQVTPKLVTGERKHTPKA